VASPAVSPQIANGGPPVGFYYYCAKLSAYYPAVQICPETWIAVPVAANMQPREQEPQDDKTFSQHNAVSFEIGGRALLYSIDFDHHISDFFDVGVGFSIWNLNNYWSGYNATVTVVPIYTDFYFSRHLNRPYITAGVDLINVTHNGYSHDIFTNSGAAAVVGLGYEIRSYSGLVLRLSADFITGRSLVFSPGVALGYGF
jgi:hypothetical protein